MKNLITVYMEHKISHLTNCGLSIFFEEKDKKFVEKTLRKYMTTYINCYYYHILDTLYQTDSYDINTITKELEGIMEEILEDYSINELLVSNEEYYHNKKLIRTIKEVSIFLAKLDMLSYNEKEEIKDNIELLVGASKLVEELLDKNINKLINLVKSNYTKENNFFKLDDEFYKIQYTKFINSKNKYLIELIPQIKVLNSNYRKTLVEKAYLDQRLDKQKMELLIQKISFHILKNKHNEEKYFIILDEDFIKRGKIIDDIYDLLNNPIFNKSIILLIPFPFYMNRKVELDNDNFTYGFIQDFSHINDVSDKISSMEMDGINYIVVSDYKEKDKGFIFKYQSSNNIELLISKEV